MCGKSFNIHPSVIKFVIQLLWKTVDTCYFVFHCISDQYKTQKICHKAFSEDSFMLKYCLDRSKNCLIKLSILFLPAFRFVRNWFV